MTSAAPLGRNGFQLYPAHASTARQSMYDLSGPGKFVGVDVRGPADPHVRNAPTDTLKRNKDYLG